MVDTINGHRDAYRAPLGFDGAGGDDYVRSITFWALPYIHQVEKNHKLRKHIQLNHPPKHFYFFFFTICHVAKYMVGHLNRPNNSSHLPMVF